MNRSFLTAEWRWLAMLNYEVLPATLKVFLPPGTELDTFNGITYASVVGFLFLNTRVFGLGLPFHRNFEEVNLRFYVRHKHGDEWKRGVVFVRELVPRRAIAWLARTIYHEPYLAVPMQHLIEFNASGGKVRYGWERDGRNESLEVDVRGEAHVAAENSEESFITEHYWGYNSHKGVTNEYEVEHPSWKVWTATNSQFDADIGSLYGEEFIDALNQPPRSAFLADGSPITVRTKTRL